MPVVFEGVAGVVTGTLPDCWGIGEVDVVVGVGTAVTTGEGVGTGTGAGSVVAGEVADVELVVALV